MQIKIVCTAEYREFMYTVIPNEFQTRHQKQTMDFYEKFDIFRRKPVSRFVSFLLKLQTNIVKPVQRSD